MTRSFFLSFFLPPSFCSGVGGAWLAAVVIAVTDISLGQVGGQIVLCLVRAVEYAGRRSAEQLLDCSPIDPGPISLGRVGIIQVASGV